MATAIDQHRTSFVGTDNKVGTNDDTKALGAQDRDAILQAANDVQGTQLQGQALRINDGAISADQMNVRDAGTDTIDSIPREPTEGHGDRDVYDVPEGMDPEETRQAIADAIAENPAPFAHIENPGEEPQETDTFGQPISSSVEHEDDVSTVNVVAGDGHIFSGEDGTEAGIDYEIRNITGPDGQDQIVVDRIPYGDSGWTEPLRDAAGDLVLDPHIDGVVREVLGQ